MTTTSAIEAQNVVYSYPDGTSALKGVTFCVRPGEKIALVGPNGAGKSTLLLALTGFVNFQGTIEIVGEKLTSASVKAVRRKLGIVFQDPDHQLFMPTVEEDVAFGPMNMGMTPDQLEHNVVSALEQTGTSHLRGKAAHHLSGGEKRRVAIATVLSMQPEILIMDEPASNLDPRGRRSLINLLKSMPQTLLIAGHDLEMLLELCPRALILDDGQIVAEGPTSTLFADQETMQRHGLEVPGVLRRPIA